MIRIPAGTYHVGSTQQEREEIARRYKLHTSMLAHELEARDVTLPEFYIDEFPVTNAQYAAFIRDTGASEPYDWPLHATAARADHPVAGVGGSDAEAYAKWAGKRLPTPEEWEAAFTGFPVLPNRSGPCSNWIPKTYPITQPGDPASKFGVHGHGQVCEWTSVVKSNGQYPFRLMKGAAWLCQEAWSLRRESGFVAFAPWCRQWTGLRCVADRDVGPAPVAPLPEKGAASYHDAMPAKDHVALSYGGGRGIGAAFPGVPERIGVACPEGLLIDDASLKEGESSDYEQSAGGDAVRDVAYRMRFKDLEMTARFQAGPDFFDMNYEFQSRSPVARKICPSACVNAGLIGPLYDMEGVRSFVWTDRDGWAPLRSLSCGGVTTRWVGYLTLPSKDIRSILVAVIGRDSPYIFGYGRPELTALPNLANNFCFSCIHIDPNVTLPPGGHAVARARLYAIKGGLDDILRRFVNDFGLKS